MRHTALQLAADALAIIPPDASCADACRTLIRDAEDSFGALSDAMGEAASLLTTEGEEAEDDELAFIARFGWKLLDAADALHALQTVADQYWERERIEAALRSARWDTPAGEVVAAQIAEAA